MKEEDSKISSSIINSVQKENNSDEEEDINTTYCPYKKMTNFFGSFFGSNDSTIDTTEAKIKTEDTEKGINDRPKCPFGFTSKGNNSYNINTNVKNKPSKGKCPFGFGGDEDIKSDIKNKINVEKEEKKNQESDSDSGDEEPRGGCPVMGKGRKDPENKNFEQYYEIPCFGNYDFMFFLRGGLTQKEWIEKTEKLRKYPRHMKYTLFYQHEEKLKKVHEAEFPRVFFIYDDLKHKGIRLYNRKKYREALEIFNYAYGLMKWIEFKDKKRQEEFVVKPSLDGILDEEIEEKHVYLDAPDVEEEPYLACVIYLLEIMAYCHIELRHYTSAIECLDEAASMSKDLVPNVYFRRAQARIYNKNSKKEDYELAKEDINKAIILGETRNKEIKEKYDENSPIYKQLIDLKIYYEHRDLLEKIMQDKTDAKVMKIRRILGKNVPKTGKTEMENNIFFMESCIFSKPEDIERQFKILKEMKSKYNLAVKFFTETKDAKQLELTYKEYEAFHETYEEFKFFYKFNVTTIDPKLIAQLSEEEKNELSSQENIQKFNKRRYAICEAIFGSGNFNIELYRWSLDKVFTEERKKIEEEKRKEEESRPKVSIMQKIMSLTKGNFGIYMSMIFVAMTLGLFAIQIWGSGGLKK